MPLTVTGWAVPGLAVVAVPELPFDVLAPAPHRGV